MVMGQFVTTYRKDYLWPYVQTFGLKPQQDTLFAPKLKDQPLCACHCLEHPPPTNEQRQLLGPPATQEESWSRLGPMGPLLDPKMYPAKVSATPESPVSRYNQPNVFLQKLKEKYPFIYECLRTAPPDDLLSRITRDRLRSTYQVDFGKMTEYPSAPYDDLIRAAGAQGICKCSEPVRLPGDPYRPLQQTSITQKITGFGGKPRGGSAGAAARTAEHCAGSGRGPLGSVTPGSTEYQDAVSRLGAFIIKDKIHIPGKKNQEIHSGDHEAYMKAAKKEELPPCPKSTYRANVRANLMPIAFRPGIISNQFGGGKPQASSRKGITSWNPFVENPVECDEVINKWGKMIYRDILHAHGELSTARTKL